MVKDILVLVETVRCIFTVLSGSKLITYIDHKTFTCKIQYQYIILENINTRVI